MIAGYIQVNLKDMVQELGEEACIKIINEFQCPLNKDVETFLKRNSILFAKQGISATHLVFASYQEKYVLVGYYTLAQKYIRLEKESLSKGYRKKVLKFGQYDSDLKRYIISAPLIAQLGKNYSNNYNNLISGNELLKLACDKVALVQATLGGKIVYLECEEKTKLLEFYSDNGFVNFGKRMLERDEVDILEGRYLIQMLKYIK